MQQRDELEIHAKNTGNQVQRQKHGGQHGQRAHDLVGAVALRVEVHLHRSLGALLQPAHVVDHTLNVLQHIAAAHVQQFALVPLGSGAGGRPGFQGFYPVLQGGALVFTDLIELMQRQPGVQQRAPVVETGAGVKQLRLPVVQLVREFAPQVQVAVHHMVDDAQHQVGRPVGQAGAGGAGFGRGRAQQFGGIGVTHRAVGWVHGQQHMVKHGKADRTGVDTAQNWRPAARAQVAQRQPRPA